VLLLFGLGRMIFQLSPGTELALLSTLLVLMFGVPGLLGNWLLYTVCRKKMAHALRESVTLPDACALLTRQASSRQRFLWLVSANTLAMAAALALYGWNTLQAGEPGSVPMHPVTQPTETAVLPTPAALPSPTQTGLVTYAEAPVAPVPPVLAASDAPRETATETATQSSPAVEARPTPPARQRFYINVGLFAKDANAQNALDKLERAGLSTLSSTVSTSQGERTRVRAGPFNSEQEANAAAKTIRTLNLDAVVMRQSP